MSEWLLATLTVLAVYRATRLATTDRITRAPREKLQWWFEKRWERKNKWNPSAEESDEWQSMAAYLLSCPWCASIWVGIPIVWAVHWVYVLPAPELVWLAASAATGWLASHEED